MNQPVEKKVTWSSLGAYLGGVGLMAIVQVVSDDPSIIGSLPDGIELFVVPLIPTIVAFIGGWVTKHTPRPDLPPMRQV